MVGYVAPVRAVPGRSRDGTRCRRCLSEIETLPHIFGFCPYSEALRNIRHHAVRSMLAEALKEVGFTVHQDVQGLATQGSVRRIDIIAYNSAYILDPTIRFETHADQPHEVDSEKKRIYEPTIPFYKDKYSLSHIDVIGLMVGARGIVQTCGLLFQYMMYNDVLMRLLYVEILHVDVRGEVNWSRTELPSWYGLDCTKTGLKLTSDTNKASLMRQLSQELMGFRVPTVLDNSIFRTGLANCFPLVTGLSSYIGRNSFERMNPKPAFQLFSNLMLKMKTQRPTEMKTPKPMQLVMSAIKDLREPKDPTPKKIAKYIMSRYLSDASKLQRQVDTALKRGVTYGILSTDRAATNSRTWTTGHCT
ncbi:hypothetical protein ANN_04332 [Periplaneta americana]|uniref:H15 domain-containing protein n=1 Tax=Periplaneta americana TaxID=6978 RepID=A0ABQ8T9T2_PERAM|nr:hypothetical protein ANN_04332 [Periplaneta americana]